MTRFFLLETDISSLIKDLLPFLLVIILGAFGLLKKVSEGYLKRQKRQAREEGRSPESPFEGIRDFLRSLEPQQERSSSGEDYEAEEDPIVQTASEALGLPSIPHVDGAGEVKRQPLVRSDWTQRDTPTPPPLHQSTRMRLLQRKDPGGPIETFRAQDPNYSLRSQKKRHWVLRSGGSLKKMVILSEILGAPVALRSEKIGPPGLRRD